MAMCVTILFVQEQLLVILPNIQFTTMLLVLFASLFTLKENIVMIIVYVFLDSLYMGALNPLYMTPMLIGWMLIPISYNLLLRKTHNEIILAFFGLLFGFIYGWVFIPFRMLELGISEFWPYLLLDIPFEILMALSNFLTILWLYKPLYRTLSVELEMLDKDTGLSHSKS